MKLVGDGLKKGFPFAKVSTPRCTSNPAEPDLCWDQLQAFFCIPDLVVV
jgi:hypothetical protein